jgi:hypothetical protein
MDRKKLVINFAWAISAVSLLITLLAWLSSFDWDIPMFSPYVFFPLFGLIAFSLMWSHYIASVVRQFFNVEKAALKTYFETTSLIVLIAIFLHPGLLMWQLWRDGSGLPPGSVYDFVAPGLQWVTTLGIVSLCVFLAYELRRFYDKKPWWKYVGYATDVAMVAIFYHGLRLGGQLSSGWFRIIWIFYGITLALSLIYIHSPRVRQSLSSVEVK